MLQNQKSQTLCNVAESKESTRINENQRIKAPKPVLMIRHKPLASKLQIRSNYEGFEL